MKGLITNSERFIDPRRQEPPAGKGSSPQFDTTKPTSSDLEPLGRIMKL